MFDSVSFGELAVIGVVALVVIGPKDLPRAMRFVGTWVGKARAISRQFRSGFDEMMREAELDEMERKWREQNERIMRDHPVAPRAGERPAATVETPERVALASAPVVSELGIQEASAPSIVGEAPAVGAVTAQGAPSSMTSGAPSTPPLP